jgi:hypothetical protein
MTDVIGSNNFLKYFNTTNTSAIIGAINSTFNGGAVFGSLMGGFTMDVSAVYLQYVKGCEAPLISFFDSRFFGQPLLFDGPTILILRSCSASEGRRLFRSEL